MRHVAVASDCHPVVQRSGDGIRRTARRSCETIAVRRPRWKTIRASAPGAGVASESSTSG
jgi:hypothetical protein